MAVTITIGFIVFSFLCLSVGIILTLKNQSKTVIASEDSSALGDRGGLKYESSYSIEDILILIKAHQWRIACPIIIAITGILGICISLGILFFLLSESKWFPIIWFGILGYFIFDIAKECFKTWKRLKALPAGPVNITFLVEKAEASKEKTKDWPPNNIFKIFKLFLVATITLFLPAPIAILVSPLFFLPICLFYFIIWFLFLLRLGSSIASVPPVPNTVACTESRLLTIIDQINDLEMPFNAIKDDKNEITIEWVSNKDKRKGILKREKVRKVIKVQIQLDSKSEIARTKYKTYSAKFKRGFEGINPTLSKEWKFFKGIVLTPFDPNCKTKLDYHDGNWSVDNNHRLVFAEAELKVPLVKAICFNGWSYKPVMSFWRWLGG